MQRRARSRGCRPGASRCRPAPHAGPGAAGDRPRARRATLVPLARAAHPDRVVLVRGRGDRARAPRAGRSCSRRTTPAGSRSTRSSSRSRCAARSAPRRRRTSRPRTRRSRRPCSAPSSAASARCPPRRSGAPSGSRPESARSACSRRASTGTRSRSGRPTGCAPGSAGSSGSPRRSTRRSCRSRSSAARRACRSRGRCGSSSPLIGSSFGLPLLAVPLPARWKVVFHPPVDVAARGRAALIDSEYSTAVARAVRATVQDTLDRVAARRPLAQVASLVALARGAVPAPRATSAARATVVGATCGAGRRARAHAGRARAQSRDARHPARSSP